MDTFDNPADEPRRNLRKRRSSVLPRLIGLLIVALVTAGGVWVWNNPQPIIDRVTVWQFEPDAVIEGHVERLAFTDHGRFLYYASQPTVSSGETFSNDCPIHHNEYEFGVLGCYVHSEKRIYVFDVTDPRLDGAEEVVAAHEMLHAAWDRLGEAEKDRLRPLLEAEHEKLTADPESPFAKRMSFYDGNREGQLINELHSIIGTEIADVSPELEEYYAQYFEDRSIVTGLHTTSNAVFVQLKEQADEIVSRMTELRESIESDYAAYTSGYDRLNADIEQFNDRARDGYYTSPETFNAARSRLMARGENLDAHFESITARVAEYEALRAELETINETSTELQRGLNIGGAVETDGL